MNLFVATAITALTLLTSTQLYKLIHLHTRLSTLLTHSSLSGDNARAYITHLRDPKSNAPTEHTSTSLPDEIAVSPEKFRIVQDNAFIRVPASELPRHLSVEGMLAVYLRYTMTLFSTLPQAYLIRFMTPRGLRYTFGKEYIQKLEFKEGNVVNGAFSVISNAAVDEGGRRGWRIVLGMKTGDVEGRLVVSMVSPQRSDGELEGKGKTDEQIVEFVTETWMWVSRDSKTVMPLERRVARWWHEVTSWWLIEQGTKHLRELRRREDEEKEK
jgi:hypothetical protein